MAVEFARLDARTTAYLERVTGKTGIDALRAWIRFTGFSERHRCSVVQRIAQAVTNAKHWRG